MNFYERKGFRNASKIGLSRRYGLIYMSKLIYSDLMYIISYAFIGEVNNRIKVGT